MEYDKNEIANLSAENQELREENDRLKSEQGETQIDPAIEKKILGIQTDMSNKLVELEESLSLALRDNKSLSMRLANLQAMKEK